jgi:hypothetical protein
MHSTRTDSAQLTAFFSATAEGAVLATWFHSYGEYGISWGKFNRVSLIALWSVGTAPFLAPMRAARSK